MKKIARVVGFFFSCLLLFGFSPDVYASVAVYRLYNPNAKAGAHHYTPNSNERDHLVRVGWRSEGVGFYAETAE
ncbi:hypothetical protein [Enterococcus raffinosus]|uniref:hypothetical protein n=1 Tax=Enterococcus raffinosus TaxID=71452 RepID=UPI001C987D78|nr:hypothetical protein [Enterococcus raffinosus]QZO11190.1 hypothetical protein K5P74_16270 [Enterococcus raffinosus]